MLKIGPPRSCSLDYGEGGQRGAECAWGDVRVVLKMCWGLQRGVYARASVWWGRYAVTVVRHCVGNMQWRLWDIVYRAWSEGCFNGLWDTAFAGWLYALLKAWMACTAGVKMHWRRGARFLRASLDSAALLIYLFCVLCSVFCVFEPRPYCGYGSALFAPFGCIVFMLLCEGFVLSRVTTTVIRHLFPSTVIFPCGVLYRQ